MILFDVHAEQPVRVLVVQHQIAVAREFYSTGRPPQAAAAFERYLKPYSTDPEANEVRLLLGIIYARDLHQYEAAERHLTAASEKLTDQDRRAQCTRWLAEVRTALGRPPAHPEP